MSTYLVTGGTGFIGLQLVASEGARRGKASKRRKEPAAGTADISAEAAAMAFLMKGIHF